MKPTGGSDGSNRTPLREIVEYWSTREAECGLGVDWTEAHERCWRCGYKSSLQRCHIIPRSLRGFKEPSNLVLLCIRCHREAPNVNDPRFMWIWLRTTCTPLYDFYLMIRGIQEFEKMFGRKPFINTDLIQINRGLLDQLVGEEMDKAIIHFGVGRLNPSTIASVLALIEERMTGKPISAVSGSSESQYFFETINLIKPSQPQEK